MANPRRAVVGLARPEEEPPTTASDREATLPTAERGKARKIVVVMPAYNAAKTVAETHRRIPPEVSQVILVDDHSQDETVAVASALGCKVIRHPHNVGYGGNQKTCYMEALRDGAEVVVMLHPDGQYEPEVLTDLVAPILEGRADFVLGSRMLAPGGARAGGMPMWKRVANAVLTGIENRVMGTSFAELHSGYRAYSAAFLRAVPFLRNSNDFVFDTQMITQAVAFGQRIVEVPARSRYFADASSVGFLVGLRYGLKTLWVMLQFLAWRLRLARPAIFRP